MGKTKNASPEMASPRRSALAVKKVPELKTLSGISRRMIGITNESEMKDFRAFLWAQADQELRPSLLLFLFSDLDDQQREYYHAADTRLLTRAGLADQLNAAAQEDPVIANYLASAWRLEQPGRSQEIKEEILATAKANLDSGSSEPWIDTSLIEIMLAIKTPDRHRALLDRELSAAQQDFSNQGISPPETEIFLLPPFISALASNCDLQPAGNGYLRSARFYHDSRVILVTDDRAVIDKQLLIHELTHARQQAGASAEQSPEQPGPIATRLLEALTERSVARLSNDQYYLVAEDKKIIDALGRQFDDQFITSLEARPAEEMVRAIANRRNEDLATTLCWLEQIGC